MTAVTMPGLMSQLGARWFDGGVLVRRYTRRHPWMSWDDRPELSGEGLLLVMPDTHDRWRTVDCWTGDRVMCGHDSTQLWYVLGADELAELCDYLDHADPAIRRDAYSHWCATGESGDEMPRGWTPPDAARLARQLYRDDLSRADERCRSSATGARRGEGS